VPGCPFFDADLGFDCPKPSTLNAEQTKIMIPTALTEPRLPLPLRASSVRFTIHVRTYRVSFLPSASQTSNAFISARRPDAHLKISLQIPEFVIKETVRNTSVRTQPHKDRK
jgi:hypothetical protein